IVTDVTSRFKLMVWLGGRKAANSQQYHKGITSTVQLTDSTSFRLGMTIEAEEFGSKRQKWRPRKL
ncbi:MAG: hypothetical protein AAFR63_18115, partial [Cyanobacteria bacterium J06631_6]